MSPDQINDKLRAMIRSLLAMPANSVRPANQNAPTGKKDEQFATVLVSPIGATGWDAQRYRNEGGGSHSVEETVQGQRLYTASIQFYKGDASAKAQALGLLLQSAKAAETMQRDGIGLVRVGQVRDLSAVDASLWEPRAGLDIEFHAIATAQILGPTYGTFPVSIDLAVEVSGVMQPPISIEVTEP